MSTGGTTRTTGNQLATEALEEAAVAAGLAPSIHNTQPWRWHLHFDTLDLFAERSRLLDVTDPDGRLATMSCGAALHHARSVMAAQGWHVTVTRLADLHDPDHLARLHVNGPAPAAPDMVRCAAMIPLRHTDRRPVTGDPVTADELIAITTAVESQGVSLHILRPDQILDLASETSRAQRVETADKQWQEELAQWTGSGRDAGLGLPDAVIPRAAPETTVPGRDFGHPGDLPPTVGHDRSAAFGVLYGPGDEPADWLRAGEALSAGWLTATELGVSLLPLSAPTEVIGTRESMRRLLAGIGHPYLALRLGHHTAEDTDTPHTPRLPSHQIIRRETN